MSKVNLPKIKMQNFDDLFGVNDETWVQSEPMSGNSVIEVNISDLVDFKDHPFKVLDDEKMAETVESIKKYVHDYRMNLYDYHDFDNFDAFKTELGFVFKVLSASVGKWNFKK